jgi:uncharacterized surface protein with fasciclin (FAS1) repeats
MNRLTLTCLTLLVLAFPITAQQNTVLGETVADVLDVYAGTSVEANSRVVTFQQALAAAELSEGLENGEFTVFAPTEGGFTTLLQREGIDIGGLLASEALRSVLGYHILPGRYTYTDLAQLSTARNDAVVFLPTVRGDELKIQVDRAAETVRIADGQASVLVADLRGRERRRPHHRQCAGSVSRWVARGRATCILRNAGDETEGHSQG